MTMDYSPWSERENWPFLKVAISPKLERPHPPKLVYMYLTSTTTCMIFLSRFRLIKIFDESMVRKGKWPFLKVAISPKQKRTNPQKLGVHACDIIPYLHEFFEPIPIN